MIRTKLGLIRPNQVNLPQPQPFAISKTRFILPLNKLCFSVQGAYKIIRMFLMIFSSIVNFPFIQTRQKRRQ